MFPYITEGQGAQNRIAKRMDGHISVRMCDTAYSAFYFYPAEPQRQSFRQCVDIISVADSYVSHKPIR